MSGHGTGPGDGFEGGTGLGAGALFGAGAGDGFVGAGFGGASGVVVGAKRTGNVSTPKLILPPQKLKITYSIAMLKSQAEAICLRLRPHPLSPNRFIIGRNARRKFVPSLQGKKLQ